MVIKCFYCLLTELECEAVSVKGSSETSLTSKPVGPGEKSSTSETITTIGGKLHDDSETDPFLVSSCVLFETHL